MGRRPYLALVALLVTSATATFAHAQAPKECLASYEAAQRERLKHDLDAAERELLVCAKPECPEVLRSDCRKWLDEVARARSSIVVVARANGKIVSDVTLTLDDKTLPNDASGASIAVTAGKHRIEVESIDYDAVSVEFTLAEGERNKRIEVELHAPTRPQPVATERNLMPVYGLAALGVVGIGSFTYFGLRSHSRKNDLEDCKGHCSEEEVDRVKRDQLIADISLGVGLLCLGGATYLYLQSPRKKESVRVGVGPFRTVVEGVF